RCSFVSSIEQQSAPVDAVEDAPEPPVGLQRRQHRCGSVSVAVAIQVSGNQPVAQEQEGGLGDVRQAVAPEGVYLTGVEETLDLTPVDVTLAEEPDRPRRPVEGRHPR